MTYALVSMGIVAVALGVFAVDRHLTINQYQKALAAAKARGDRCYEQRRDAETRLVDALAAEYYLANVRLLGAPFEPAKLAGLHIPDALFARITDAAFPTNSISDTPPARRHDRAGDGAGPAARLDTP